MNRPHEKKRKEKKRGGWKRRKEKKRNGKGRKRKREYSALPVQMLSPPMTLGLLMVHHLKEMPIYTFPVAVKCCV